MKEVTITVNRYETGDVLDVSAVDWHTLSKKKSMSGAKKAMVTVVRPLATGEVAYKAITDTYKTELITPREQSAVKYIGCMDISLMFNK